MKKIGIFLLIISAHTSASAQKGLIKRLLSNEKDTTRKSSFLPVPVAGYSQEKGFEFGAGAIYAFYLDKKDTSIRSSTITSTLTYSTKKTYNFTVRGDVWTKQNLNHLMGEIKFRKVPFHFFGIGNSTFLSDDDALIRDEFKIQLEGEKKIAPYWYSGLSAGFDNFRVQDKIPGGIYDQILSPNRSGSNALFFGVSQSFDSRNSNNYPTKGVFSRITYQYAPKLSRTGNFYGSKVTFDTRGFIPLNTSIVLALQGYFASINGDDIPFYRLQQLGNDGLMRGYYSGRYRDKNLLATQAELRYRYNNRFGGVLFAGAGNVFGQSRFSLKPNFGAGLRYFFDPAKGLSVRLDYGIGEKRVDEQRQSGFYISLAEAF